MTTKYAEDTFYQSMFGGKSLDELSDGIKLLREYIWYNNFDFLKLCQTQDKYDAGKLPVDKFEHVLSKADFNFPSEYIKQIIEDAPKSEKREIMYRDLYIKLKNGGKPKTRISSKLLAKANSLIDFIGDQVDKTNVLIQFFGRKQMYELKNYDLDQIDTQIFKTINQPAEDTEKAVRNILFSNTQAIIENFEIQVARQIYQKLFTSTLEAPDALMKEIFLKFFRYKENDLYQPILEVDFYKMMESFQVKLTLDESNLLYVLIYRGYSENAVTLSSIMEWVKGYHKKILKSIIKFDQEDIQSLNKQIQKKVVMADLMTDIIKTISEITFERFEQGVDLITKNGMIEFDSFYRMIKQLDIIVDFDSANSFKKYLAEEGVLSLSNMDDIQRSAILINAEKFLELVRSICKSLFIHTSRPKVKLTSTEAAVSIFQQAVYQSYWIQIKDRIKAFADPFSMITETKLREVIKIMVIGLDNYVLDSILDSLKFNEKVGGDNYQRKIYVDEFWAKISDQAYNPPPRTPRDDPPETVHKKQAVQSEKPEKMAAPSVNQDPLEEKINYTPNESKQLLIKLKTILEQLLESDVMEIGPEEKGIITLPLLRIMNSYDTNRDGIIELDQFRKVIIEFFPILTALEVNILCNMAKNISVAEVKELKDREHDDKKYISYYHLIMQIEKYYTYEKANSE